MKCFKSINLLIITLTIILGGCIQSSNKGENDQANTQPLMKISDAVHLNGNKNFYLLPPLVKDPSPTGVFDAAHSPIVQICELLNENECVGGGAPFVANFTSEEVVLSTEDEHYKVNWHTDDYNLDPEKSYRILISVGSQLLGYADVDVVTSGKELKNVETDEFIPLKDGRTFPIKFRIEEGAVITFPQPIIAYDFNEGTGSVLTDITGNGNNGTISGAQWDTGIEGGALRFRGWDTQSDVVTTTFTPIQNQTVYTLEAWINAAPLSEWAEFLGRSDYGGTTIGYRLVIDKVGGNNGKVWSDFYPNYHIVQANTSITDNTWHHIVTTVSATEAKMYVDGVLESTTILSAPNTSFSTTPITIGASGYSSRWWYKGLIDEVRIYDVVLTDDQVQARYDLF